MVSNHQDVLARIQSERESVVLLVAVTRRSAMVAHALVAETSPGPVEVALEKTPALDKVAIETSLPCEAAAPVLLAAVA